MSTPEWTLLEVFVGDQEDPIPVFCEDTTNIEQLFSHAVANSGSLFFMQDSMTQRRHLFSLPSVRRISQQMYGAFEVPADCTQLDIKMINDPEPLTIWRPKTEDLETLYFNIATSFQGGSPIIWLKDFRTNCRHLLNMDYLERILEGPNESRPN